jgi:hypothetical protein
MSSRSSRPSGNRFGDGSSGVPFPSERELIVVTSQEAAPGGAASIGDNSIAALLAAEGASLTPVFENGFRARGVDASSLMSPGADAAPAVELAQFFKVDAADSALDELAASLLAHPTVTAAYIKPPTFPARFDEPLGATMLPGTSTLVPPPTGLNDMTPAAEEAPPATPDFSARQIYRLAAPAGVDAVFAATVPGGRGAGVRVIDIEGEWRFTHEDLVQNQGGLAAGSAANDIGWRNHGTAVIGEIGGDTSPFGILGIAPDANVRGISIFGGLGSAGAITRAADLLSAGDIILIELHRPGPNATGVGQQGFIAVEWWPDDLAAIRYATSRGVIVVEAAGNGAENLDAAVYDVRPAGFPATWRNPFRRNTVDSGAILVGAGAPPPGTHGRDWGPDRSRLDFSNFGALVDAQGWGREVTTTGYGDLQGGSNEDFWYTDTFSGTSSASPIVVGALACAQGTRRAQARPLLTPATARSLLRTTGSPQQDAPTRPATQRIGNRPNLRQLVTTVQPVALTIPLYRYWNPQNTDHFYTTSFTELGTGRFGWQLEGIQCYVIGQSTPQSVPLYRYWNGNIGDHFYTTNFAELGAGRLGYAYEGIQCYVYTQGALGRTALYRYWNPQVGDHFYTTNFSELGQGRFGYRIEGVQCFVATSVAPPAAEAGASDTPETFRTQVDDELQTIGFAPTGSFAGEGSNEGNVGLSVGSESFTVSSAETGDRPINIHIHLGRSNGK